MTNHDDMPTRFPALVWAVIFTILLVAAVAVFALVLTR
jgi:ABC-type transporter Mla subunit MlaD